jgi:hypothetical protein
LFFILHAIHYATATHISVHLQHMMVISPVAS